MMGVHYGISCAPKDISDIVLKLREMGFTRIRHRPDRLACISAEYDHDGKDLEARCGLESSVLAIDGVIAVVVG